MGGHYSHRLGVANIYQQPVVKVTFQTVQSVFCVVQLSVQNVDYFLQDGCVSAHRFLLSLGDRGALRYFTAHGSVLCCIPQDSQTWLVG